VNRKTETAKYCTSDKVTLKRMIVGMPYHLVYWPEDGSSWECEENLNKLALKSYYDAVKQRLNEPHKNCKAKAITVINKSYQSASKNNFKA
jgi:hypothetical protein